MTGLWLLQADIASVPILIGVALVIILGYVARAIFARTKIPEALVLIAIGLLLVPIGHLLPVNYIDALRSLAAVFGDIALVVIMYNGGKSITLSIDLFKNTKGAYLGILDNLLVILIVTGVMSLGFGWPLIDGALVGAILGGTATVIIVPIIKKLHLSPKIYETLYMETTLNSVIAILAFTLLLYFAVPSSSATAFSAASFSNYVVDYMSVAIVLGLLAGLLWLIVQSYVRSAREYVATLAVAIFLYGMVELFNGSAPISVLIFALMLGNYKPIVKLMGLKINISDNTNNALRAVEHSLEFLITTFFFVFIGMIAVLNIQYLFYAVAITILLIVVRYIETRLVLKGEEEPHKMVAFSLMQRGTTVAVLSALLFAMGGTYFTEIFYINFMVIILTNIVGSLLISTVDLNVIQPAPAK